MKILLAHHDALLTTVGGIEKVCVTLANGLHAAGHDVIVATHAETQGLPFFPLEQGAVFRNIYAAPSQNHLLPLKKYRGDNFLKKASYRLQKTSRTLHSFFTYGYSHKRVIRELAYAEKARAWKQLADQEKPDVIVTMSMHVLREMTCGQKYTVPIVHSVNSRPDYDYTDTAKRHSKILQNHLKEPYRHLSGIQILFSSFKRFLPETFEGKTYVIPNVVPQIPDAEIVPHTNAKERFTITNISRLDCKCKQQDFAIRAFREVADKYPKWDLHFWGDGEDKTALERLIRKFNLEGRIFLKGVTPHPMEEVKKADIFIFPSRYEGFGLALAEAMSVGLPAIGLASCSGVNELIRNKENGFLVNNAEEFVNCLDELMYDTDLRNRLGQKAHEDMKRFTPEDIFKQWQEALHDQISTHTSS